MTITPWTGLLTKAFFRASVVVLALAPVGRAAAAGFEVNRLDDSVDINPGDGFALDAEGKTSLRAAVMESEALPGADTIKMGPGRHVLSIAEPAERTNPDDSAAQGDLDIHGELIVSGTSGEGGPRTEIVQSYAPPSETPHYFVTNWEDARTTLSNLTLLGLSTIAHGGELTIVGCRISTPSNTGVGATDGTKLILEDTLIEGCSPGVFVSTSYLRVSGCDLRENKGRVTHGAAIYLIESDCIIEDSRIGEARSTDDPIFPDPTFGRGIAIYNASPGKTVTLKRVRIRGCKPGGATGLDYASPIHSAGPLFLEDVVIENNTSGYGSSAIESSGGLVCNRVAIVGNWGAHPVWIMGSATLRNVLIQGNTAARRGSFQDSIRNNPNAILVGPNNVSVTMEHCTIVGNLTTSADPSEDGAIFSVSSNVQMRGCIVTGNRGTEDPYYYPNPPSGYYSLDIAGTIQSLGDNIIGVAADPSVLTSTDLVGVDPLLGPLVNLPPALPYMPLLLRSPAIDRVQSLLASDDIRGAHRPQDGNGDGVLRSDSGAYEFILTDAERIRLHLLGLYQLGPYDDPTRFDRNGDGAIDAADLLWAAAGAS